MTKIEPPTPFRTTLFPIINRTLSSDERNRFFSVFSVSLIFASTKLQCERCAQCQGSRPKNNWSVEMSERKAHANIW